MPSFHPATLRGSKVRPCCADISFGRMKGNIRESWEGRRMRRKGRLTSCCVGAFVVVCLEFYASSRMQRLRASHNAIRLLNTQHTLAIEVVHEQILPVCKAPSWQLPRVVERQVSGDLAVELSFVERISPENALPSPSRVQNDQFRQVAPTENPGGSQPARETWRMQLFQHTHAQLAQLHWTLPSWPIFQREFLQRSMSRDHTNESAESSTPLTAASDNVGTTGNVKDRSAVKPPFWKMCDRQPLAEVALSIFQA